MPWASCIINRVHNKCNSLFPVCFPGSCVSSSWETNFDACSNSHGAQPHVTSDMTVITGCKGDFEADCPDQSCWWFHRPENSCPVWLWGHLQLLHYSYSDIPFCWTGAEAESLLSGRLSAGSVGKENKIKEKTPDLSHMYDSEVTKLLNIQTSMHWRFLSIPNQAYS